MQPRVEIHQVAVVCKHPVVAPEFTHKRVAVFQRHPPLRGLADVRNHLLALDRIALDEARHWRRLRREVVHEMAQPLAFEKGDAKAIRMFTGTLRKAGEAENDVGGGVAVHAQQLAHGGLRGRTGDGGV